MGNPFLAPHPGKFAVSAARKTALQGDRAGNTQWLNRLDIAVLHGGRVLLNRHEQATCALLNRHHKQVRHGLELLARAAVTGASGEHPETAEGMAITARHMILEGYSMVLHLLPESQKSILPHWEIVDENLGLLAERMRDGIARSKAGHAAQIERMRDAARRAGSPGRAEQGR